jgi:hypothetical protein
MSPLLSRFSLRLLVPGLALTALAAFGDPLPPTPAPGFDTLVIVDADAQQRFALALQEEAETLRQEAEAAKKAASRTAAQMRWFLTLPAAGANRSTSPGAATAG